MFVIFIVFYCFLSAGASIPNNKGAIPPTSHFPSLPHFPSLSLSPPPGLSIPSILLLPQSGPLKPARRSGERCKLAPPVGRSKAKPQTTSILVYSEREKNSFDSKLLYAFLYTAISYSLNKIPQVVLGAFVANGR